MDSPTPIPPADAFPDDAVVGPGAGLPPVDPDLALLESYLDGELTPPERAALQRRLSAEAELSAALGRLSAEYEARQAVWTALEATPAEAARVARRITAGVQRDSLWTRHRRWAGWAAAAAACFVCFAAGWVGRGTATAAVPDQTTAADSRKPGQPTPASEAALVYQVAITDEQGNITAVQKFDSLADAQAFAADLSRWQARQVQLQNGTPVLVTTGL